jgi:hypothetical protein
VTELEPLGMLNPTTREILATYCVTASVNFNAYKAMTPNKKRGPDVIVPGARNGEPVRSKSWGIFRESAALLESLGKALVLPHPNTLLRAELPSEFDEDDESDLD